MEFSSNIKNKTEDEQDSEKSKKPSEYADYFKDANESELCRIASWLPDGMSCGISIDDEKDEIRVSEVSIHVTEWNNSYKEKLENVFRKMQILKISTRTPDKVVPWILLFKNLELLYIDNDTPHFSEKVKNKIKIDRNELSDIEDFDSLTINLSRDLYSKNENIPIFLTEILKKFKQKKRLDLFTITENYRSIKQKVLADYFKVYDTEYV